MQGPTFGGVTWADFVRTAYKSARSWGMQPSEFWGLSPQEWWWEFDEKLLEHKRLTKKAGGLSQADWEAARKKHKERMAHG